MPKPSVTSSDIKYRLDGFDKWLTRYGEISQDHQDFYASRWGGYAKSLYYKRPLLGKLAVLPMVFCEAVIPWTRKYFFQKQRLPISDAHFAMAYFLLHQTTNKEKYLKRAVHFLDVLMDTKVDGYGERLGWGYPFDWSTGGGVATSGLPLITTTPYGYEAFEYAYRITGEEKWRSILKRIAEHVRVDYDSQATSKTASTCSYFPGLGYSVINANAYRAFTLFSAWSEFDDDQYLEDAIRNINFVLENQAEDGSWPYAVDGKRFFIDHFHTCFVMKGLAKIEKITSDPRITEALDKGINYYVKELFAEDGLPKPFSVAPRATVYRRELYDCAECINLGVLLRGRYPELDRAVDRTIEDILNNWIQKSGCFRSRKLYLGWDNTPMHRWGQSEMFRALSLLLMQRNGQEIFYGKTKPFTTKCAE